MHIAGLNTKAGFAAGLTCCFLALSILGVVNHELWRDEWQGWLIAKEATSWAELLQNQRYEAGRSLLWAISLFGISRIWPAAIAMQIFHVCVAAISIYLIARFSPFQRWQKIALCFGYFLFFEYAQISRDYALSIVFIFLFCALFRQRNRYFIWMAVCLFCVANTNFYALLISVALGAMVVLEQVFTKVSMGKKAVSGFLLTWLAGLAIALYFMLPPTDGTIVPKPLASFTWKHVSSSFAILWKAYCPMPGLTYHFWNTNLLDDGLASVLSVGLVAIAIALFRHQPLILFLYTLGTSEIIGITYAKFPGTMRHWGYLFILFLTCLWLTQDSPPPVKLPSKHQAKNQTTNQTKNQTKNQTINQWQWLDRHKTTVLNGILCVQLAAGLFAYSMDMAFPFTAAKAAAQFIQTQHQIQGVKMANPDWAGLPVGGYLGEALYYPSSSSFGTFIKFNIQRRDLTFVELAKAVNEWTRSHPSQPILLILNDALADHPEATFTPPPTAIGQFTQALLTDENYHLYCIACSTEAGFRKPPS
jgi:hypothetical protein